MVDRYIAEAHSISPLLPLSAYSRIGLTDLNYIAAMKGMRLNITDRDRVRPNTKWCFMSKALQTFFVRMTKRKRLKHRGVEYRLILFFLVALRLLVGLGILYEFSPSRSDTSHSVGFLWTSDRPVVRDLYLKTHNTHKRKEVMCPARFKPAIQTSARRPSGKPSCPTGIGTTFWRQILFMGV